MSPVGEKVPVSGSKSSALASGGKPETKGSVPPAINTLPFSSSVAVWFTRFAFILPVRMNSPRTWAFAAVVQIEYATRGASKNLTAFKNDPVFTSDGRMRPPNVCPAVIILAPIVHDIQLKNARFH